VARDSGVGVSAAGGRFARLRAALTPSQPAWSGAIRGLAVGLAVLWLVELVLEVGGGTWRNWTTILTLVLVAAIAVLAAGLVTLVVRWAGRSPAGWLWGFLAALLSCFVLFLGSGFGGLLLLTLALTLGLSLLGGGIAAARRAVDRPARVRGWVEAAVGAAALLGLVALLATDGPGEREVPNAAAKPSDLVPRLEAPNPAATGSFEVATLTYGSGTDRRRPEYGSGAALRTQPYDGSRLVRWKDRSGWIRTWFWGFDAKHMPIQGRVYYPKGTGPFPLVLAVHGNHSMEDYSDPGYAYLGRLMASRGIIFVSVDENFLNSSISDLLGIPKPGLDEENDARGVVLLEHLKAWRGFAGQAGNPFAGKVDLDRIALIGHSRGGEAVAVAAAFNRLPYDPDDGRVKLDYGFGIRSVIAIAPADGQYLPAGEGTPIRNVSYLTLQGSYDGDVVSFDGARQWSRVTFDPDSFGVKAAIYVHGANHGQFNTSWGRDDAGGLRGRLLNFKGIMDPERQRQVAQVYISAFLELTLRDRTEYLPLFVDRRAGGDWLPPGIILSRVATSSDRLLASYDEDIDLRTTTQPGGTITGANLADWREKLVKIKWGDLENRAAFLGWNRAEWPGADPSYQLQLPDSGVALRPTTQLVFALADAKDDPSPRDPDAKPKPKEKAKPDSAGAKDRPRQPIDLTVELVDRDGHTARMPLSAVRAIQPQLEAKVIKIGPLESGPRSEIVFQSYALPLGAFPGIDPARLRAVRLVFDRTPKGVIVLDDVGFRN
jgi:dienelactone hydrolase